MQARRATSPSSTDQNRTQTATKTTRSHTCSCGSCSKPLKQCLSQDGQPNNSTNRPLKRHAGQCQRCKPCFYNQTTGTTTDMHAQCTGQLLQALHHRPTSNANCNQYTSTSMPYDHRKRSNTDHNKNNQATQTTDHSIDTPARSCGKPCFYAQPTRTTDMHARPHTGKIMRQAMLLCSTDKNNRHACTPTHRQDHAASHASMLNRQEQPTCMHAHTPARSCGNPCFYAQPTRTTDMHARPWQPKLDRPRSECTLQPKSPAARPAWARHASRPPVARPSVEELGFLEVFGWYYHT